MCCGHECVPGEHCWLIVILCIVALWDSIWKLIALWKAARNKQMAWFICLAIFNTVGILPIIYLLTQRGKKEDQQA
jgi:hypothetical protein